MLQLSVANLLNVRVMEYPTFSSLAIFQQQYNIDIVNFQEKLILLPTGYSKLFPLDMLRSCY